VLISTQYIYYCKSKLDHAILPLVAKNYQLYHLIKVYTVHISAFRDPITLKSMCNCTKKGMSLKYATKKLIYRLKQEVEVWEWRE